MRLKKSRLYSSQLISLGLGLTDCVRPCVGALVLLLRARRAGRGLVVVISSHVNNEGYESFILHYVYRSGYIMQEERILEVISKEFVATW